MGKIRNRKKIYETRIQLRIPLQLKRKALYRSKDSNLSSYIRKLIEKDCENIEIYNVEEI